MQKIENLVAEISKITCQDQQTVIRELLSSKQQELEYIQHDIKMLKLMQNYEACV